MPSAVLAGMDRGLSVIVVIAVALVLIRYAVGCGLRGLGLFASLLRNVKDSQAVPS